MIEGMIEKQYLYWKKSLNFMFLTKLFLITMIKSVLPLFLFSELLLFFSSIAGVSLKKTCIK